MIKNNLFSIPPGAHFLASLAEGILAEYGADPLTLNQVKIFLPTKRACRNLRSQFLNLKDGKPMILPQLYALGDFDEDQILLYATDANDLPPPAISPLRRQLLLTRLILSAPEIASTLDQAAQLAHALAKFMDEIYAEGLDFAGLADLVPEEYAQHWQVTLDFLKLVTQAWPAILAEEQLIDPFERRNQIYATQIALWTKHPPQTPVIIAGSIGSLPAVRDLMRCVLDLPHGKVILPQFDMTLKGSEWETLDPTHPQYYLGALLDHLKIPPYHIAPWPYGMQHAQRQHLMHEMMRPAQSSDAWADLKPGSFDPLEIKGLNRIDCATPQEEAMVIALILRQVVETKGKTGALITPDRALARRVVSILARWNIEIDDSAGVRLENTPIAIFLKLAFSCALKKASPASLLSLLKHPYVTGPKFQTRQFEIAALRQIDAGSDLDAYMRKLVSKDPDHPLIGFLNDITQKLTPLIDLAQQKDVSFHALLHLLIQTAESLSTPDKLWSGQSGEEMALFLQELMVHAAHFPHQPPADIFALLEHLLKDKVVRTSYGLHPRLYIFGLLEARLQQTDLVIMAGLNEGTFPPIPSADPWLSRPMRQQFGLPPLESKVGIAAHDFCQNLASPEVYLTRSQRVEGTPTVPARWLLRLETILQAVGFDPLLKPQQPWLDWARMIDAPIRVQSIKPPAPMPPVELRPQSLSVTEIETLMRDPYAIYAKHVLKLRALDPLEMQAGPAERGQIIHAALDRFVMNFPQELPDNALEILRYYGQELFGDLLLQPEIATFWWVRYERIIAWFFNLEEIRRQTFLPIATEVSGQINLGTFTLRAKADRIDKDLDGSLRIIDYKTGSLPTEHDLHHGYSPQLPLEALIAQNGGFKDIAPAPVSGLHFWQLTGNDPAGKEKNLTQDLETLITQTEEGVRALIAAYQDPSTPYPSCPKLDKAPFYSDYTHLARVQEWSAGGDDATEEAA